MIETNSPAIFCATETWLRDSNSYIQYHISNYHFECVNSIQDHGAGVALYIKNNINYKVVL